MIKRDATLHWYFSNYISGQPAALVLSFDNDWRFDITGWWPSISRQEHIDRLVNGANNATDKHPGSLRRWLIDMEARYVYPR